MQPIDQTSIGQEYRDEPNNTSGARYQRVTTYIEKAKANTQVVDG